MTEKDLKKLNRKQLLELLLKQTERADRLQQQLSEAEQKLQDRTLIETNAGSIAEASLKLNGVFEAAEAAAAQYIENIKKMSESQALVYKQTEAKAMKKAEEIIARAESHCAQREAETEKRLEEISAQIQQMYKQKKMLDEVFEDFTVRQKDGE